MSTISNGTGYGPADPPSDGFYVNEYVKWNPHRNDWDVRVTVSYRSSYKLGAWIADCDSHEQARKLAAALNATLDLRGVR